MAMTSTDSPEKIKGGHGALTMLYYLHILDPEQISHRNCFDRLPRQV